MSDAAQAKTKMPPTEVAQVPAAAQRWVLAALLGAVLLNAHHTAVWCVPLAAGAAAWRSWAGQRSLRLMGRALRIAVALVLTLAVLISFRTLNGLDAGASLLVVMAALKLMETQRARDWLIVLGASLFLLLAACLASQALWLIPLYGAELWLLCTALYALGGGATTPPPRLLLRDAGRSLLIALPLAIVLFLFFPRLEGALWTVPKEDEAVTGLSDQMSPGSISQLSESEDTAMHVRFDGPLPPRAERYWRGPVLHEFDGYTWSRSHGEFGLSPEHEFAGRSYHYEVTLEPNTHGILIALDLPRGLPDEPATVFRSFDDQLVGPRTAGNNAFSYRLESFLQHRTSEPLLPRVRRLDLLLPRGRNPRSIELAQRLRAASSDDRAYVQAVLAYLRDNDFEYTLAPAKLSRNSIDDLLFSTHQGFCGHYASAFAMLMRAGGVPSHVVTGYLGGEWNRFGNYLLLRQANAHAWTEVWLDGIGWLRVDPTAVVAPNRLDSDLDDALVGAGAAGRRGSAAWLASTMQAWQALNAWWQDEFINFNFGKQLNLLGKLGLKERDYEQLVALLAVFGTLWLSLLAWRARRSSAAAPRDGLSRTWRLLERALRRRAAPRAPHEGPVAFGDRIAIEHPEFAATIRPLTRQYALLRYGRISGAAELQRFQRAVRLFTARIRRR
jgi:transglutaminase-like putative cysteine protease